MSRADKYFKVMSLDTMKKRMKFAGGDANGRNIKGKLKSLKSALKNSYQSEWIVLNEENEEKKARWQCLINPDKIKEDYDLKMVSIEFDAGLKEGDIFLWERTNTHWLVYLQEHNEEAYFRAAIRRCDYQIEIDKEYKTWAYVRGPVETTTKWEQKSGLSFSDLNYTMNIYIPKNEQTLKFIERHKVLKFDGHNWKITAVDKYSQEGVIEVILNEHFDNSMEDASIAPEIIEPDIENPYINGPQIVQVFDENIIYEIKNASNGKFVVNSNKVKINNSTETSCDITILTGKANSFEIAYQREGEDDIVLKVTIESF